MPQAHRRAVLYGAGTLVAAALLFAGFGITVAPDAATRLNGAALHAEAGQYDLALEIVALVLREHPGDLDARIYRATILGMARRYDEALAAFDDALGGAGDDRELARNLRQDRAALLLEAGRLDEFRAARAALSADGGDFRVSVLDGLEASKQGDPAAAARAYARALEGSPGDPHIRARLWNARMDEGKAALAQRRFAEAKAAFDGARDLFPQVPAAHLRAAETLLALDDAPGAVEILRVLSPRTPGIAPLVFRAATALLERGATDAAIEALEGAYASDPAAVKSLFETERAWDVQRGNAAVQAVFAEVERNSGGGLTRSH